jgi:sirohydrochlorin ferrochelatase
MSTALSATVLVGHGSLLEASGVAMFRVADRLRNQRVTPLVEAGFLNFSQPTLAEAVAQAHAQGAGRVMIQPYFLIDGHYVANQLPEVVRTLASQYPRLRFTVGNVLGAHPALVRLARQRLAAINPAPTAETALLFVAHGTPLSEANVPIQRVLDQVQKQLGYGAGLIGYLDCNQPDIPTAFAQLAELGFRRLDVLPYFLHLGRHVRKDLPAHFAAARTQYAEVEIQIAHHLDDDVLLAEAVAERVMENLT